MYRAVPAPSLLRRIGLSVLTGFGLFALGALLQAVLERNHIHGVTLYLDDIVLGLLAGLLIFVYEQRRYRVLMDKIRVIAEMNHHVRNALQAIALSRFADESRQIQMLDESTRRIQWALQKILPGADENFRHVISPQSDSERDGPTHSPISR
jgi:hypothetical protein